MDRPFFVRRQSACRVLISLAVVGLGISTPKAAAQQVLYAGNDNAAAQVYQDNLPLTVSTTPNFTLTASGNVVAIAAGANGNLLVGLLSGGLQFFPAPLSGSTTSTATFNNGAASNNGQAAFLATGDVWAATVSNRANRFNAPFSNASAPAASVSDPGMVSIIGVAVDGAQNLYLSNAGTGNATACAGTSQPGGGCGSNLYVYAPPYTGAPIITPNVINLPFSGNSTAYRKITVSGSRLYAASVANGAGRVDVYNLPITASSTPAFALTTGVNTPEGLALDASGDLYIGNLSDATVTVYNAPITAASVPSLVYKVSTGAFAIFGIAIGPATGSSPTPAGTLPAVASTPGVGSFFRTAVQLHNDDSSSASGRIVFHTAGTTGMDTDPSLTYTLNAGETQNIPDLLPAMGQSGIGSADIFPTSGNLPTVVARVFNDGGSNGTAGFTEDLVKPSAPLTTSDQFTLVVPADLTLFRYNIGVRTFAAGASISVTQRRANGTVVNTMTKTYPATYFLQTDAKTFLGADPSANDTLTVQVTAGSLVIYGATTDNHTQDPSVQFSRK